MVDRQEDTLMTTLELNPSSTVEADIPVTLVVRDGGAPSFAQIRTSEGEFQVPLTEAQGGVSTAQMNFARPGQYEIRVGTLQTTLHVTPRRTVSFLTEFGLVSAAVALTLGAIVLWKRKKMRGSTR